MSNAPYDYSRPIVVNNFVSANSDNAANQPAMKLFNSGLAAFQAGQYPQALRDFDGAIKLLPGDPVLHEVRALSLFALGKFQPAAAALDSLLASAPGMDWTTLSSLYGNIDDYTAQLRVLEQHVDANPSDAAAAFVLAYHYLVVGHIDEARDLLRKVVQLQPKDATARRLLASLEAPAASPSNTGSSDPTQETDLVGRWRATPGDVTIELTVGENSQFTWRATPKGKPAVELKGDLIATNDMVILETDSQGSMVGMVKSAGPNKFQFVLAGGPPDEAGLSFERQK